MTDITKCNDEDCPQKKKCYRWWSKEGVWQSYFMESPRKGDECSHYWELTDTNVGSKKKEK